MQITLVLQFHSFIMYLHNVTHACQCYIFMNYVTIICILYGIGNKAYVYISRIGICGGTKLRDDGVQYGPNDRARWSVQKIFPYPSDKQLLANILKISPAIWSQPPRPTSSNVIIDSSPILWQEGENMCVLVPNF